MKIGNVIKAYYRTGNSFKSQLIGMGFYFDKFLIKEELGIDEGTVVYCNETELAMVKVDLAFVKRIVNVNST